MSNTSDQITGLGNKRGVCMAIFKKAGDSNLNFIPKIIVQCISQAAFHQSPFLAIAAGETASACIDGIVSASSMSASNIQKNIEKICREIVPERYNNYTGIIQAAVEICIDNVDLFKEGYDAEAVAKKLTHGYISKYNNQFQNDEIARLQRFLPQVLEQVIYEIEIKYERDAEFQIIWKNFIHKKMKQVEEVLYEHSRQIKNVQNHIQAMDALRSGCTVTEQSDFFRNKWDDNLFLDDYMPLRHVYQLPCYDDFKSDLQDVLQKTLDLCSDFRHRMLVILGHPGSGKSTLITYLLNNCSISKDRTIRCYRFSGFESIDWNRNAENLPQVVLNELHLSIEDLNDSVLILDGLDEIDMRSNHVDLLNYFFGQWAKSRRICRFSLIITCRANRIADPGEIQCPYITLCPLNENQIDAFIRAYCGKSSLPISQVLKDSEGIGDVLGIPLILYMVLALDIRVNNVTSLGDVYSQIFSLTGKNSIYSRQKYDSKHIITATDADKIHLFSKKIAEKMWELRPSEAYLEREEYESIAFEIAGEGEDQLRKLLIGQFFIEGQNSHELYFVHRSMYEYFVALSLYDSIQALLSLHITPTELYVQNFADANVNSPLNEIANKLGIQCLSDYPDIQEYLFAMLKQGATVNRDWWLDLLNGFTEYGLADAANERRKGGLAGITEETNRFYNLVWLTKEHLKLAGVQPPYNLWREQKPIYLFIPTAVRKDLSDLNLDQESFANADFEQANISGSVLKEACLIGANLSSSDLTRSVLKSAKMYGADLSDADLSLASLENADLRSANLSGANLRHVNLNGADLRGVSLQNTNLNEASLVGANLEGVSLCGCTVERTVFTQTNMQNTNLDGLDLNGLSFRGANLSGATLIKADLQEADMSGANLLYADFSEANLQSANLTDAQANKIVLTSAYLKFSQIERSNLSGANLDGADLELANLNHCRLDKADLSNANLRHASLCYADLREAQLIHADFSHAVLTNADMLDSAADNALCDDRSIFQEVTWHSACNATGKDGLLVDLRNEEYPCLDEWDKLSDSFNPNNPWSHF